MNPATSGPCKLCAHPHTEPLSFLPAMVDQTIIGTWRRCQACGCDSSSHDYESVKHIYDRFYLEHHAEASGDMAALEDSVLSNCEWFGHYEAGLPHRNFLDIGCADGAALNVMQRLGWAVHGFDVTEPPYMGPHVTVRPFFQRWWFQTRFAAVMAREVIEHVDSPSAFLHECHGVLVPGGIFQVQTPKTADYFHGAVYQQAHLLILTPKMLLNLLEDAMFDVLDFREWGENGSQPGMAYLCRAKG